MGEYFWAGLLTGLLIWVVAEVSGWLFRRRPMGRAGAALLALIPAEGKAEGLEHLLRLARTELSGGRFPSGGIVVIDRGMETEARQMALRFEGARVCREKDLGPALAGLLPPEEGARG